ncbi:site-2 protease family protein [Erythrobacter sp. HL-111]|uniref:site-2 protease family protein n=1 Tax=Erythrobacter sp. HL-111 TaxID=1798193 RepID=UPI0006DADA00|nr:site-2 protease family protein [Erythrobacter sp. HL-111]KPP88579.1 MAG: Zn-dependent protease [Erythrobacteraceae bacterium HL-111]SDS29902.1 Zn-dependent protease (includes SpoIVFB) [Erythrobacter sp. HL-111]
MEDTVTLVLLLVPCLIVAIVFHEVAHGYVAKLLGDPTASERGRLTLNPIRHVDPVGTLLVPGALLLAGAPAFGWAKPVPVNQYRLKSPRYGMMAVALAGPASNFVLAALGAVLIGVLSAINGASILVEGNVLGTVLTLFLLINIFLGLFNLLPIPPFDGSHIVGGLLPDRLRFYWARLQQVGIVLLLGVIAYSWFFGTGWLEALLLPPLGIAMGLFLHLADIVSGL